jgi:hypothetical protein
MFGTPLESDVDVCHIISKKNGGADHPDNYDFVRGRSWNRMTSHKYDHVNCFLAGKESCQKAVVVSRVLGTYTGPDADELYEAGERSVKRAFAFIKTMEREVE